MSKPKIHISWSGGKDSALALHRIRESQEFEIVGLHTVFDQETKRVGIHEVPEELIEAQADLLDLPLTKLYLPKKPMAYDKLMKSYYHSLSESGVSHVMFGDIFLEDLKDFREQLLRTSALKGVYPLWKENSTILLNEFLDSGFKTILCAVDAKYIDVEYVGKYLTKSFINAHQKIDACGENGEYHSLVVDGPGFKRALDLNCKEKYERHFSFKVKDENGHYQMQEECFYFAEFELKSNS